MDSQKGPGAAQKHDGQSPLPQLPYPSNYSLIPHTITGSPLRIAIIHARWNTTLISALLSATRSALLAAGVSPQNIITDSVPGSYELPFACQKVIAASQIQAASSSLANLAGGITAGVAGLGSATRDLLGGAGEDSAGDVQQAQPQPKEGEEKHGDEKQEQQHSPLPSTQPFDAIIAIGVLIKGESMHFEYIADAVSHGLMRVQLDTGVPVIFGLLTVLTEGQGRARAGMDGGHNHGEDWGNAAVELGCKRRGWGEGRFL